MYGLRSDIDLSFLNGRELVQLGIGLYQMVFRFDEDVAISIEGEFRYSDGQEELVWQSKLGSAFLAARTVALLGTRIDCVERNAEGSLALGFSNGHRLTLLASSPEYESYNITRPGQTIVV